MTNVRDGIITSAYFDEVACVDDPCTVDRTDTRIRVRYHDPEEGREVVYEGDAKGAGHYEVTRDDGQSRVERLAPAALSNRRCEV